MDKIPVKFNIIYGNTNFTITLTKKETYLEFIRNIFDKVTNISLKNESDNTKKTFQEMFDNNLYLTWCGKIINSHNWNSLKEIINDGDTLFINRRLKGGIFSSVLVVLAILGILYPILRPIKVIANVFIQLILIIVKLGELVVKVLEIIPVIFDPPKLIDDIMFAVTYSINTIFSAAIESIRGSSDGEAELDLNKESGTFGISKSKQNSATCMDPTYSTIFLLLVCPPLAIFYKLGFLRGFISSIICAVLCVKLYYFPGVLFATLHVLC